MFLYRAVEIRLFELLFVNLRSQTWTSNYRRNGSRNERDCKIFIKSLFHFMIFGQKSVKNALQNFFFLFLCRIKWTASDRSWRSRALKSPLWKDSLVPNCEYLISVSLAFYALTSRWAEQEKSPANGTLTVVVKPNTACSAEAVRSDSGTHTTWPCLI